ncbi:unnamed protein product [Phytophthora fragariaefolia]|uniref:Unnamed protein product n=1 Tax=Phytophthora fragariaefolia TaxID=1490495 RepID=A0A9W6TS47_9STRA|nr:unnamed protein product [Phytophthora fragariaefolia]
MVVRRETRSEAQAFLDRLGEVHNDDRARLVKEHREYLDGDRPMDADFTSARNRERREMPVPRRPPTGKGASYMRANKRLVSEMCTAVAAKTIAGSGNKRIVQKKKDVDETWEPDDEDDAEDDRDEDGEYEDDGGDESEPSAEEGEDRQAKPKVARKPIVDKKSTSSAKKNVPKPRKKSARTLAKEARETAAAEKKATAAKQRQAAAQSSQVAGKLAKEKARKRMESAQQKKADTMKKKLPAAESSKPLKKRRTSPHERRPDDRYDKFVVVIYNTLGRHSCCIVMMMDEICFLDDEPDVEIERSPEPEYWSDVSTECRDAPAEVDLDAEADVSEFEWPVLEQAEMLDFARDEQELAKMRKTGWELDSSAFPPDQRYPHLYDGAYGPSDEVMEIADSPLELFLFFMPRSLWRDIAAESTLYHEQHLVERVDRMYLKQTVPGAKSKDYFMEREAKKGDIKAHEVVIMLGLLVARMINPQRRQFYDHWSTSSVGAIAGGTFGKFMKRHRFIHILSNLHFTNNASEQAGTDRAWKVRSVVRELQQTFLRGYTTPPVLSLDEAMIPLHNRHNPTRQYVANKPHKWGTKLFMTCCANSSYCLRLEVYCGKAQHAQEIGNVPVSMQSVDHNTGPAAVMRNLEAVLPAPVEDVFHLVVTDRFYTSVQLAYQLLQRQIYLVGTIQDDRQGFSNALVEKNRDRPKSIPHGTTRMAVQKKRSAKLDTHAEFLTRLQAQMLELTEADFEEVWPHFKNNTLTCHQIWHHLWKNGTERPRPRCGRDIQHREAGSSAGKRKRRRRQASSARGGSASEQEAADSDVESSEGEEARGDEDSDNEREEADVGSGREHEKESVEDVTPSSPEQSNNN